MVSKQWHASVRTSVVLYDGLTAAGHVTQPSHFILTSWPSVKANKKQSLSPPESLMAVYNAT